MVFQIVIKLNNSYAVLTHKHIRFDEYYAKFMFLFSVPFVSLDQTWTMVMVCAYKYVKKYFPSPGWYSFEVQFSNPCLACRPPCRRCLKALFSISPVPERWRCPITPPLQQQLSEEKHFVIAFVVQAIKRCCMLSEQPPCCLPSMATTP